MDAMSENAMGEPGDPALLDGHGYVTLAEAATWLAWGQVVTAEDLRTAAIEKFGTADTSPAQSNGRGFLEPLDRIAADDPRLKRALAAIQTHVATGALEAFGCAMRVDGHLGFDYGRHERIAPAALIGPSSLHPMHDGLWVPYVTPSLSLGAWWTGIRFFSAALIALLANFPEPVKRTAKRRSKKD
jgi:hypothetical protein